ncbi:hypothetical protein BHE74_00036600 [Ensete ventricosum]|nr:hypothetical protein BHE74_00036600 [Ensete ventricosum]
MEGPVRPSVERPERVKHSSMIDQRSENLADGEGKERNAVLYLAEQRLEADPVVYEKVKITESKPDPYERQSGHLASV